MNWKQQQKIQYWVDRLDRFDWHTAMSDDHRVYTKGEADKRVLWEELNHAELTTEEKETIVRIIGYRTVARHKESAEYYDCVPKDRDPLTDPNGTVMIVKRVFNLE